MAVLNVTVSVGPNLSEAEARAIAATTPAPRSPKPSTTTSRPENSPHCAHERFKLVKSYVFRSFAAKAVVTRRIKFNTFKQKPSRIGNFVRMCHDLGGIVVIAHPDGENCTALVENLGRLGTSIRLFIANTDSVEV